MRRRPEERDERRRNQRDTDNDRESADRDGRLKSRHRNFPFCYAAFRNCESSGAQDMGLVPL